jgi:hypothetical protein
MAQQDLTTIAVAAAGAAALALAVVVRVDNLMQLDSGCTPSRAARREGRTNVAANLGVSMAEARQRVITIDADLRSPQLAERLGIRTELELSDVLDGATLVEAEDIELDQTIASATLSAGNSVR